MSSDRDVTSEGHDAPTGRVYRLVLARSAARALREELPEPVAAALMELLSGALQREPRRIGKPLHGELSGVWSARRGTYRVLYEIDDEDRTVRVIDVDHRHRVYRRP